MNKLEQNLINLIKEAVTSCFQLDDVMVIVEMPKEKSHGDYSTNVAMRLAKQLKKAPLMIASELVVYLSKHTEMIEKVEVANPGFINFTLKKVVIMDVINTILREGDNYGANNVGQSEKILVEYVSANPTGNLHLGHARGAAWGDCITRCLNKSGYDCLREYYINDAGAQMNNLAKSVYSRYASYFNVDVAMPEDGYYGDDVKEIGIELVKELGDCWLHQEEGRLAFFREAGKIKELEKIKKDLNFYRCSFDSWISEEQLYKDGKVEQCIETMKQKGVTYEKEDALWFKSTLWNDDKDRVLIKSDGSYTYLVPDIANHISKVERGYEKLVNLWGADHHGYIPRMKAAMEALGYPSDCLEVDIIQMVRLVEDGNEVKMSKRTGNAITIRELCDDIGVDAARYFFVSRAVDTHLDFDLGLARKRSNENPVFYAQYAHARLCSILRNSPTFKPQESYGLLVHDKEIELCQLLNEFVGVVADAAKTRSPHKICNYIQKCAGAFHSFYGACKIIDETNVELTNERLGLVVATKITLRNAFDLIGIEAVESM